MFGASPHCSVAAGASNQILWTAWHRLQKQPMTHVNSFSKVSKSLLNNHRSASSASSPLSKTSRMARLTTATRSRSVAWEWNSSDCRCIWKPHLTLVHRSCQCGPKRETMKIRNFLDVPGFECPNAGSVDWQSLMLDGPTPIQSTESGLTTGTADAGIGRSLALAYSEANSRLSGYCSFSSSSDASMITLRSACSNVDIGVISGKSDTSNSPAGTSNSSPCERTTARSIAPYNPKPNRFHERYEG